MGRLTMMHQAEARRAAYTDDNDDGGAGWFSKKTKVLLIAGSTWIVAAMLFFTSEGYGVLDSVYNMVQILTTVGYGDLVPKTDYEKIGTAILVLSSTLLMAGIVSHTIDV